MSNKLLSHFKCVFLIGGPGSGKDFLIHSALNEFNLCELSLEKTFNAIVEQTNIEELNEFQSVIINGNADNSDKIIVAKAILEEMGYDTSMIFVYTTEEVSKARNDQRISQGAKTFSENKRKKKYNESISNLKSYANMFEESFLLFDNSNNYKNVNEEVKQQITNWLLELTESVSLFLSTSPKNTHAAKWISERVMEIGTNSTAEFIRALTPGQGTSNHVNTYNQADKQTNAFCENCGGVCRGTKPSCGDKYDSGVASAGFNSPEKSGCLLYTSDAADE